MDYNFDEVIERCGTNAIKCDDLVIQKIIGYKPKKDSIYMWVADMDFASPNTILNAIKKRTEKLILSYTNYQNDEAYFDAIMNWFNRRHHLELSRESIVYSAGTVEALSDLVQSLTSPLDGVIIQRPVYGPFTRVVVNNKRKVLNNALINNNGIYEIDFKDLEAKAKLETTKMMILCNPHNPVGRVWSKEELKQIIEICLSNNVILVSDEIHGDLIRSKQTFTPVQRLSSSDQIITCTAINKTFNTAGLHCSNIIINNKEYRNKYIEHIGMQLPNPFAIEALKAAYNESEDWVDELKIYIDRNFETMQCFLNEHMPLVKFNISEGTYLGWVDFRAYNLTEQQLMKYFIEEAGVVVESGTMFGNEGLGFVRFNLACPHTVLVEALNRVYEVFKNIMC